MNDKQLTSIDTLVTIDMTPTWAGVLPILLAALEDGNREGKRIAREELQKMAAVADKYNALVKGDTK